MSIDWNAVSAITGVLQILGALVLAAIFWRMKGEFASKKETERERESVRERLDNHGTRLTRLETSIDNLPTGKDLHALGTSMERLSGEIRVAVERVSGVKEDLGRMEKTLMRHEDILSEAARRQG